jgi:hypothetical protein
MISTATILGLITLTSITLCAALAMNAKKGER